MRKQLLIIGNHAIGSTILQSIKNDVDCILIDPDNIENQLPKVEPRNINDIILQDSMIPFTNTYQDSYMDYNVNYHKKKNKKPYWKNGKLKYK